MKFTISSEQIEFFEAHQSIEFEELLDLETLKVLNDEVDRILGERLKLSPRGVALQSANNLFMAGHDFWRENEVLGKIIRKSRLARYAADLVEQRPLRLGFDQLFTVPKEEENNPYISLLKSRSTLEEFCCLQGVLCGLMLCLDDSDESEDEAPLFSFTAGNGVFFSPEKIIDYDEIMQRGDGRYLLIVYTHVSTVYTMNKKDPQLYAFKKYGYSYGDKLSDSKNPIVCR